MRVRVRAHQVKLLKQVKERRQTPVRVGGGARVRVRVRVEGEGEGEG